MDGKGFPTDWRKPALTSVLFVLPFALVAISRAWVSDDAYITFRTVVNFVEGYGLTWNPGSRVQAFTHPLWMLLMSAAYLLSGEMHFTSMAASLLLGIAGAWLLVRRVAVTSLGALVAASALTLSKAYVDYTTSGLENPLSNLLLVLFAWLFFSLPPEPGRRRLFALSLLASLGLLTRLDLVLVFGPPLLLLLWQNRDRRSIAALAAGQTPLLLWGAFSLFYFGFLLPNTFYAKLSTGIPSSELAEQGLYYLLNSLEFDPVTLFLVAAGMAATFTLRSRRAAALALGVVLYLVYVVRAGGDFMSGRFLVTPLLASVVLLARTDFRRLPGEARALLFGTTIFLGLMAPHGTLDFQDPTLRQPPAEHVDGRGISDERLNYAPYTGLLQAVRQESMPAHVWAFQGTRDASKGRRVAAKFAVGFYGYNAGRDITVIDQLGLGDALLARLPAARDLEWRVGHYVRTLPEGYQKTLETGETWIKDENLARYFEVLDLITSGPLFSRTRLVEIYKFNTGQYDHLVDWEAYRYPDMVQQRLGAALQQPVGPGTAADDPGNLAFGDGGIQVNLLETSWAPVVEASLSSDDDFSLVFLLDGVEQGRASLRRTEYPEGGLAIHRVRVVLDNSGGFNQVRIFPEAGDGQYRLGHLRLVGE